MYGDDLASVHESGFQDLAQAAARELLERLGRGERRTVQGERVSPLVVELGCGGGTLCRALADEGWRVLGVDVSPSMLDIARRRVPEGRFFEGDALAAAIPRCTAVAGVGEVFSYAARRPEDVLPAWQRIHDALAPGGVFLFDVAAVGRAPEPTHAALRGRDWRVEATAVEEEGRLVRTIDTWRTVDGEERHTREVHDLLLFDPEWVEGALGGIGFQVERLGGYDDFAFQQGWDAFSAIR